MPLFLPTRNALVDKTLMATTSMWAWMRDITAAFNGGNGFAPADATYFLRTADADLPNARVATNSATITLDYSTPGQVKWNALSSVPIHTSTLTFTNAELLTLPSSFLTIVSAPVAGTVAVILEAMLAVNVPGAGTYANITSGSQAGFAVAYGDWDVDGTNFYSHWDGDGFIATLTPFVSVPDASQLLGAYPGEQNNNLGAAAGLPVKLIAWNDAGNYTGGDAANHGAVSVIYTLFDQSTGALS